MTDTQFEVILEILFLKISNADMLFDEKTLTWKTYITNKALFTIKQIQIINKNDFVIAALDADSETFVVHIAFWKWEKMPVYSERQA